MMLEYMVDGVEWLMVSRNLVSDDGMDEADCLACGSLIGCEMDRAERMDGSAILCIACFDAMVDETDDETDRAMGGTIEAGGGYVTMDIHRVNVMPLGRIDPAGDSDLLDGEYVEQVPGGKMRKVDGTVGKRTDRLDVNSGARISDPIRWDVLAYKRLDEMERPGCPACGSRDCIAFECD